MSRLDILWVIVSPCPSHPLGFNVIRHNVAVVREFLMADGALPVLLGNLAVQQLAHLCWGAKFAVPSRVLRVFNALHSGPQTPFFSTLLAAAAEARAVDRTVLVSAEVHRYAPVRLRRYQGDERQALGGRGPGAEG